MHEHFGKESLCGKENFKRRWRYAPYAFFFQRWYAFSG